MSNDQEEAGYMYMVEHTVLASHIRYNETTDEITDLYKEWKQVPLTVSRVKQLYEIYQRYQLPQTEVDFAIEYLCFRVPIWSEQIKQMEGLEISQLFMSDLQTLLPFLVSLKGETEVVLSRSITLEKVKELYRTYKKDIIIMLADQTQLTELIKESKAIKGEPTRLNTCMTVRKLTEEIPYQKQAEHDLWFYFNTVQLHNDIPFCMYQSFYKFIEHAPIEKEWSRGNPNELTAYVHFDGQFQPIVITPTFVKVSSNFTTRDATPELLLRLIDKTFPFSQPLQSMTENQKQIKAEYYIVYPDINFHVFLQYIYSHPIFSEFLFIDESKEVLREDKQYVYMYYYPNPRSPKQVITFTIKNVSDSTIDCGATEATNYSYIRVSISRCPNKQMMEDTIHFLCKVLESYREQKEEASMSRKNVTVKEKPKVKEKRVKKEGKARGNPYAPLEMSLEHMENRKNEFYLVNRGSLPARFRWLVNNPTDEFGVDKPQAMIYPKTGDQHFYVCNVNPLYKYVDLRKDKAEEEEYTPYCFKLNHFTDQEGIGSTLYTYEKEVVEARPAKSIAYEISTNKIVDEGQLGSALTWMKRWNNIIEPEMTWKRLGVTTSVTDSILYVLEFAFDDKYKIPKDVKKITQAHINEVREKMTRTGDVKRNKVSLRASYGCIMSELQTNHPDAIKSYLEQFEKGYIDPMRYLSFLSYWYDATIYLVKKDGQQKMFPFYITHPHFSNEYCTSPTPYDKCVFVVINQGTEFGSTRYPICELLVRTEDKSIQKTVLRASPIVEATEQLLSDVYGKYERTLPIPSTFQIKSQSISERGWVNWIHYKQGQEDRSIGLLEPLHSVSLMPIITNVFLWTNEQINSFCAEHADWTDKTEYTYMGYKGYRLSCDNHSYMFPIKRITNDTLQLYQWFERMSRYLVQYVLYLFSIYMNQNTVTSKDIVQHLSLFAEEFIVINEERYNEPFPVERTFTGNPLFRNQKVYVPSETVKKKLIYALLQTYRNNKQSLQEYRKEFTMRNYYMYSHDFTPYPNHHIIKSEKAFLLYMRQHDGELKRGVSSINHLATKPYMLYKKIDGIAETRFIMQPVTTLSQAYDIFDYWKKHKVHIYPTVIKEYPPDTNWTWVTWLNEYDVVVSKTDEDAPILSIVRTNQDDPQEAYVHVMLPMY
jgi:hypothetical protein